MAIDWKQWGYTLSGLGAATAAPGSWQQQLGQFTMADIKRKAEANILKAVSEGKPIDKADQKFASPELIATASGLQQQRIKTNLEARQVLAQKKYYESLGAESKARIPTYESPEARRTGEQKMQESLIGTQAETTKGVQAAGYAEKAKYEPTIIPGQQNAMYDWKTKQWIYGKYDTPNEGGFGFTDPTKMNQYKDLVNMEFYEKANAAYKAGLPEDQKNLQDLMSVLRDPSTGVVQWEKMFAYLPEDQRAAYSKRMAQYATLPKGYPGETVFADIYNQPKQKTITEQFTNPQTGTFDTNTFSQQIKQLPPDQQGTVMKQFMLENGTMSAASTPEELITAYEINPTPERYKQMLEEVKKRGWKPVQ